MQYQVKYSQDKNKVLQSTRGISFEEVVKAIEAQQVIADLPHAQRPNQRIMIIKISDYIWVVPYVIDQTRHQVFLKTMYQSRKYQKIYKGK